MFSYPEILLESFLWTMSALQITALILLLGISFWCLCWLAGSKARPPVSALFGTGLMLVMWLCWYTFQFGGSILYAFKTILIISTAINGLTLYFKRRFVRTELIGMMQGDMRRFEFLWVYFIYTFVISLFLLSMLHAGDIKLVTIGNNDIYAYAISADYLLQPREHAQFIASTEVGHAIQELLTTDVFGTFLIFSFSAFATHADAIDVTMLPMIVSCAIITTAIFWIARSAMNLPFAASLIVGLSILSNRLFEYLILNYFLAQTMASALLLTTIATLLVRFRTKGAEKNTRFFITAIVTEIICLQYIYPVMILPHILLLLGIIFIFETINLISPAAHETATLSIVTDVWTR